MKIDIFSGFLGSGKTTLIKKLLSEAYSGEQIVLIENEFGEIGIDGGFLQDTGIQITEMNSGCICCSLVGDFAKALKKVTEKFKPDRIIIEPSGVGKLSEVAEAVEKGLPGIKINSKTTVINAKRCLIYAKNFGEFFIDQLQNANCVVLSHTDVASEHKISEALAFVKKHNSTATIVSTPISQLDGKDILSAMENTQLSAEDIAKKLLDEHSHASHSCHQHNLDEHCSCHSHEHTHFHNEDHCHDENCSCHSHEHSHDEHCACHSHEHTHSHDEEHRHDENCSCHSHEHNHDEHCTCHSHEHTHSHNEEHCHDENCSCHSHKHNHDEHCTCHSHGHHADEVFVSWGKETAKKYSIADMETILRKLDTESIYGTILRAKGIVAGENSWIHFDYIPDGINIRSGSAGIIGKICVIGSNLNEEKLAELFKI